MKKVVKLVSKSISKSRVGLSLNFTHEEITNKTFKILEEYYDETQNKIDLKTSFYEIGIDSLDSLEMIMTIEDEFGIDIPEKIAFSFIYVGDVVNYVESLKKEEI